MKTFYYPQPGLSTSEEGQTRGADRVHEKKKQPKHGRWL